MFLKIVLFFIFLSTPVYVFANSCRDAIASFAEKHIGENFEEELGSDWVETIAENTKHWTRTETLQFLDFLNNRIGEQLTIKRIKPISSDISAVSFNDFMDTVRAYDQINKDIIDTLLHRGSLDILITGNSSDKIKMQQVSQIIESHIGGKGTAYVIMELPVHEIDPNEIKEVMDFVDLYTQKHGVVIDNMENRINYFRQAILLSPTERQNQGLKINFGNFGELREFSRLIYESLRETEAHRGDPSQALKRMQLILLLGVKITEIFSGFFKARLSNLKKTIAILEQYIEPEEIAKLMMHEEKIYLTNPQQLQEVIEILKKAHSVSPAKRILEMQNKLKMEIAQNPEDVSKIERFFVEQALPTINFKELIAFIMRENMYSLLSANPTHLKNAISILEKYKSKEVIAVTLQHKTNLHRIAHRELLEAARSSHVQKVMAFLEENFETDEITHMVWGRPLRSFDSFPDLWIEKPDSFINIVGIFKTYINENSVLFRRISNLFEIDYPLVPTLYDSLVEISNKLDYRQMSKLLTSDISLLELSPEIQTAENMTSDEPSAPSSLH